MPSKTLRGSLFFSSAHTQCLTVGLWQERLPHPRHCFHFISNTICFLKRIPYKLACFGYIRLSGCISRRRDWKDCCHWKLSNRTGVKRNGCVVWSEVVMWVCEHRARLHLTCRRLLSDSWKEPITAVDVGHVRLTLVCLKGRGAGVLRLQSSALGHWTPSGQLQKHKHTLMKFEL